jgi:hypothetical protein
VNEQIVTLTLTIKLTPTSKAITADQGREALHTVAPRLAGVVMDQLRDSLSVLLPGDLGVDYKIDVRAGEVQ